MCGSASTGVELTNYGNYNTVFNNVNSPNFRQFAGFLDRREGAVIDLSLARRADQGLALLARFRRSFFLA